jgi:hypothetical protein
MEKSRFEASSTAGPKPIDPLKVFHAEASGVVAKYCSHRCRDRAKQKRHWARKLYGAALELIRVGRHRAVEILFRCLFEYGIRLSCYLKDNARATEELL